MNGKYFGEIGQNVVIGELSKYGIGVAIPLSDNLPFDLIAIVESKLYKLQVKSSSQGSSELVYFDFSTNNFYTGETKGYSKREIDFVLGVDLRSYQIYLFDDFDKRKTVTLRLSPAKNGQKKGVNWHENFVLNSARIKKILDFECPKFDGWFSKKISRTTQYQHICQQCGKEFSNGSKNGKYCGGECAKVFQRHVNRPSKDVLQNDIKLLSWKSMGRKYGVSDNAVRKWARSYKLI